LYPIEWINSNLMLVVNIDVPVGLLDPFTGEWKAALLESLPNRYDQSGVAFSPDLSRALYVAGSASDLALILWDVERGRELWREENYNWGPPFEELPGLAPTIWSIDSSIVTFPFLPTGGQGIKIYAISRDGDNSQLIRPTAPDNRSNSHSWSPDDHYLAFVSRMTSEPSRRGIIIYDRLTNTSVDMCPLGEMEDASGNLETHGLIWSPDSRYLVYGMGLDVVDENNKIVMLDIYTGQVTLLQKGSRIWMEGWSSIDTWVNP
jgi:WD40 repeat protein